MKHHEWTIEWTLVIFQPWHHGDFPSVNPWHADWFRCRSDPLLSRGSEIPELSWTQRPATAMMIGGQFDNLLGGSSHLVSGLVHPSYKWTLPPLIPFITRVGSPTYDSWVVHHQVVMVVQFRGASRCSLGFFSQPIGPTQSIFRHVFAGFWNASELPHDP